MLLTGSTGSTTLEEHYVNDVFTDHNLDDVFSSSSETPAHDGIALLAADNIVPDRVHWARYAGRNFTDRQRIKRKAASWGARYEALPVAERVAVLAAMMAVEAQR